jgi:hypothetical protein
LVQYNNQIFDPLLFNRLLVSLFFHSSLCAPRQ